MASHTIRLTGKDPGLLMHNVQAADPEHPIVRDIARLNALKSKITDEQRKERDYLKWKVALYWNDKDGPILPAPNVFKSIQQAAALTRNGKDIERGFMLEETFSPLLYEGPRGLDELWNYGEGPHVDRRMATVNRAPIICIRPLFPEWSAEFSFDLDEDVISLGDFKWIAAKAGRLIHIGDYRRQFGAYTVEITDAPEGEGDDNTDDGE